tara:strand:- start:1173 stop:1343 length:171 start_codon:yes stop_codon:yes gene_type:complete
MVDLNLEDVTVCYNFLDKFLRQFEVDKVEKDFWNEVYSVDKLQNVRDKLKVIINNA